MSQGASGANAQVTAFFEGVDEMQRHLLRAGSDDVSRRERMHHLIRTLPRHNSVERICELLLNELRGALGATGATLWFLDPPWRIAARSGSPTSAMPAGLWSPEGDGPVATTVCPDGLLLALDGVERPVAVVWLQLPQPIGAATLALVKAMAGSAGMMLQGAMLAEGWATLGAGGTWPVPDFVTQAERLLARVPPVDNTLGLFAIDLGGEPLALLAAKVAFAARQAMPLGLLLGKSAVTLFAATDRLQAARAERDALTIAPLLNRRLAPVLDGRQVRAAFLLSLRPVADVKAQLQRLQRALNTVAPGQCARID